MPPTRAPNVLLVSVGQVSLVFARHLVQGGARVGFLVKPRYAEAARRGFVLYPLNRPRSKRFVPEPLPSDAFEVYASTSEAAAAVSWDYVLLTIPSTGLRGDWFDELVRAWPHARFVTFQLGLGDREWIRERVPDERVFAGMLTLASYAAPIADEPVPVAGTAYWFPPGGKMPFVGPSAAAAAPLLSALNAGGLAAAFSEAAGGSRFPDFLLMSLVAALAISDWKFATLRAHPERARLAIAASRETFAIDVARDEARAAATEGRGRGGTSATNGKQRLPFAYSLITPGFLRYGLAIARALLPLPLEAFLRVHFTKVGEQIVRDRRLHIEEAKKLGLPSVALERLEQGAP